MQLLFRIFSSRRLTRFNLLVFFLGLIIVISGVLVSSLWKTEGLVRITESQAFYGSEMEYDKLYKGYLAKMPERPEIVGVESVQIKADPDDYSCQIVLLDDQGNVLEKRDVRKNKKFTLGRYSFNMNDYGYAPAILIFAADDNVFSEFIALERNSSNNTHRGNIRIDSTGWDTNIEYIYPSQIKLVVQDASGVIFDGIINKGNAVEIGKLQVTFAGVRKWAQFQVTKDPGANIVLIGGVVLIISVVWKVYSIAKERYN